MILHGKLGQPARRDVWRFVIVLCTERGAGMVARDDIVLECQTVACGLQSLCLAKYRAVRILIVRIVHAFHPADAVGPKT
jgi:hypothetical protein